MSSSGGSAATGVESSSKTTAATMATIATTISRFIIISHLLKPVIMDILGGTCEMAVKNNPSSVKESVKDPRVSVKALLRRWA